LSEPAGAHQKRREGAVAVGARKIARLPKIPNPLFPPPADAFVKASAFLIRQAALQNFLP
jgi:hypothetical protein